MSKPQLSLSWVRARINLSFAAAMAGWVAGLIAFSIPTIASGVSPFGDMNMAEGLVFLGLFLAFYIFVIWIGALLPLSLLVPAKSFIWKPAILLLIGVFAGPMIILIWDVTFGNAGALIADWGAYQFWSNQVVLLIPASIISTTTCLTCAFLNKRQLNLAT